MEKLFFFIFQPFLSFVHAFKNLDKKGSGWVYVLFFGLFGYGISFNLTSADSYRIAARFCQTTFLSDLVWSMYREGSATDVYLIIVYAILKPFTNNPKVLFGVLGLGMGVWSYLCMREVFEIWGTREKTRMFFILAFCFFLSVSFFNVNGIRFWTATGMYVFFALRYIYGGNKLALIGVFLTPLVHYGYLIGAAAMLTYILMNKILHLRNPKFYFFILSFCFVGSMVFPESLAGDMMSGDDVEHATGHRKLDYKISRYVRTSANIQYHSLRLSKDKSLYRQANNAFTTTFNFINRLGIYFLMGFLFKNRYKLGNDDEDDQLMNFTMFFCAVGFMAAFAIGSGVRFLRLANMFLLFYFVYMYAKSDSYMLKNKVYWIVFINFYAIAFLFFNAPRIVDGIFWILPAPLTIVNGLDFGVLDFV